jgi:hypothetical protein
MLAKVLGRTWNMLIYPNLIENDETPFLVVKVVV